ncbi:MAG: hypothetical protein OHK0022_45290 [Roseiflexaceae bacterium]
MSTPTRTTPLIMLIRHGEKPGKHGEPPQGIDINGKPDPDSLAPQGWQRAGALAQLFLVPLSMARGLVTPQYLYAGNPNPPGITDRTGISKRPLETITPLSQRLDLAIDQRFAVGQEQQLAEAAMAHSVPVLISWEHKHIPLIANALLGNTTIAPQKWPGKRFDMVLVFTLVGGAYVFSQVPELLLAGDSSDPITSASE